MADILANEKPKFPIQVILDTANAVDRIAVAPHIVQVSPVPAGTTVELQARINADMAWVPIAEITEATSGILFTYGIRYNFFRAVRTAGSGEVVVCVQGG